MKDLVTGSNKRERVQSRKQAPQWLGPLEDAILSYLHMNGLERFQPVFLARDLHVDSRRIHDALQRLMRRGIVVKIARGFYKVVETLKDYPVRKLESKIKAVKEKDDTRGSPFAGPAGAGGLGRLGSRSAGEGYGGRGPVDPRAGGNVDLRALGRDVGADRCGRDPIFYDHVVGIRGSKYVAGEPGTLCWRDLVSYSLVSSAELGAFLDLSSWDGVLKIYWHRRYDWRLKMYIRDPRPRVEWQHPSGFLKANGITEARRAFWRRVADAALALARLVLEHGPWWVARDLKLGLRGLGLCR